MPYADLVFRGGPVFTADTVRSRATAVAVAGGRIVAVGHEVDDLVGPGTEVVDLRGRMLVPGAGAASPRSNAAFMSRLKRPEVVSKKQLPYS